MERMGETGPFFVPSPVSRLGKVEILKTRALSWRDRLAELRALLSSVPPVFFCFFTFSLFAMNMLANKSLTIPLPWLAMDAGLLVSWAVFLLMSVATRHFGPSAATVLSVFSFFLYLLISALFLLASLLPGVWSAASGEGADLINAALNKTFGGTWYVLLGSAVAFLVSAAVNNFAHFAVLCRFKRKEALAFAVSSFIAGALGQFADNLVFSLLVSRAFFGWTLLECVGSALAGVLLELAFEALFLGLGANICKRWRQAGVGEAYFRLREENKRKREAESCVY